MPAEFYDIDFIKKVVKLFDEAIAKLSKEEKYAKQEIAQSRSVFVSNCISATAPARQELSKESFEAFAFCLKDYVQSWLKKQKVPPSKGKEPLSLKSLADYIWKLTRVRIESDVPEGTVPPTLVKILEAPATAIEKYRVINFTQKIENGWRLPPDAFTGGVGPMYYKRFCEGKIAVWVRGTMTDVSRMRAKLVIDSEPPQTSAIMEIEGQDSDKYWSPPTPIMILVNGRKIFEGPNGFVKRGWSRRTFKIPPGTLKKGENIIEIRNLANSDTLYADWFMLSELLIKFPKE